MSNKGRNGDFFRRYSTGHKPMSMTCKLKVTGTVSEENDAGVNNDEVRWYRTGTGTVDI